MVNKLYNSIIRFAPVNGTEAANYFERMGYIEERFYESVKDSHFLS